jgi:signal transduction histidine kinase
MWNRALRLLDVGLAVVAAAALIVEGSLRATGGLAPGAYVLAVASAAPLAWRSRAPLAALAGVEVGAVLCVVAFDAGWAATGMVIVELYTVARLGNRQRSLVVGGVTAIAVIGAIVVIEGSLELTAIGLRLLLVFAALAVGDTVRSRLALRAATRERTMREAREREEENRRRTAEERVKIARELHDTLAHALVAINVRASVAVDLPDSQDPAAALRTSSRPRPRPCTISGRPSASYASRTTKPRSARRLTCGPSQDSWNRHVAPVCTPTWISTSMVLPSRRQSA